MSKDTLKELNRKLEEFESKKRELYTDLKTHLFEIFKPVFEEHPGLQEFSWNQYSPWNDGDSTTFGIYADVDYGMKINGCHFYNYNEDGDKDTLSLEQANEAAKSASNAIYVLPEDFLKEMFGDYNTVTVRRDGVMTSEECQDE